MVVDEPLQAAGAEPSTAEHTAVAVDVRGRGVRALLFRRLDSMPRIAMVGGKFQVHGPSPTVLYCTVQSTFRFQQVNCT